jgi:predicted lipoprotein with Yx(FWY)xxD motif
MRPHQKARALAAAAIAVAALTLTACGSSNDGAATDTSSTVSTRDVSNVGTVLVNAEGKTLYFTDQEGTGSILCQGACANIWIPLTVPGGTTPTAGAGVTGALDTVSRPDGTTQVTHDGKPLYLFSLDTSAGQAGGNGVSDSFDGTTFVWHAATASGSAPPQSPAGPGYGY